MDMLDPPVRMTPWLWATIVRMAPGVLPNNTASGDAIERKSGTSVPSMLARNRKALILLALAGVVGLAVFAPQVDQPVRSPQSSAAGRSATSAGPPPPARAMDKDGRRIEILSEFRKRGTLGDTKAELFGPQSWQPPPSKAVASPPLPEPPPMIYRFAGRLLQDGKLQVFVSKGDTALAIKQGDVLEGGYVVEAITADTIALVYPPLGHKASISIPAAISTAGALPANPSTPASPFALGSLPSSAVLSLPAATRQQGDAPAPATAPKPNSGLARVH